MTWQRIDENTYIDDTLVTCAEYQLFIDEMREQGKYYQPDHWISSQFPEGQAHAPILGVRCSDAVVFCEWLTKREKEMWLYQLPTSLEAQQYPSGNLIRSLLSYWIIDVDKSAKIYWASSVPENPKNFDLNFALDIYRNRALNNVRDRGLDLTLDRTVHNVRNQALDLDSSLALVRERAHAYENARDRARGDLAKFLDRALDLALELSHALEDVCARDQDSTPALTHAYNIALGQVRDPALSHVSNRAFDLATTAAITVNAFLDLYILQERVAGRSPAFEGIRLVKERIR